MEGSKHRVLLVEDDVDTREELEQILRSLSCVVVSCDNKQTALQHVAEQPFCMAVLDLQIFGEPGDTKPYDDHGRSLLRDIRKVYPHYSGSSFTFPIVVVSAYAAEWEAAKEVTQDGASDIIRKPPKAGELSSSVRLHFQRSGREDHAHCARAPAPAEPRVADLQLSVTGVRHQRRTQVTLGSRVANLTDGSLRVLLRLMVGRLSVEFGSEGSHGRRSNADLTRPVG